MSPATGDRPSICARLQRLHRLHRLKLFILQGSDRTTERSAVRVAKSCALTIWNFTQSRIGKATGDNQTLSRRAMRRQDGTPPVANAFIAIGCASPLRLAGERRKTGPNSPSRLGEGFQFARGNP